MGTQFKITTTFIAVPRVTAAAARTFALLRGQTLPAFTEQIFEEWFKNHSLDQAMQKERERIAAETDSGDE